MIVEIFESTMEHCGTQRVGMMSETVDSIKEGSNKHKVEGRAIIRGIMNSGSQHPDRILVPFPATWDRPQ
jgi:hypothetical protein